MNYFPWLDLIVKIIEISLKVWELCRNKRKN
jgi:hypothetical protein